MNNDIYLCVDPGNNLGVAATQNGIIVGKTTNIKAEILSKNYDKIEDAILSLIPDWSYKIYPAILWTRFQPPKMSVQSLMNYFGMMYIVLIAMENLFDEPIIKIDDDKARGLTFSGHKFRTPLKGKKLKAIKSSLSLIELKELKKSKKEQAHDLLVKRFDLSRLDKKKLGKNKGTNYPDTMDSVIGALALKEIHKKKVLTE